MKKVLIVCMVLVMLASTSIAVFAASGAFVESPSKNPAPELVEGKNTSEDCAAQIIIAAYGDRDELTAEQRQKLEAAYAMIIGTQDLSTLNGALKTLAEQRGVSASDLAVSDLFDISATECDGHADHGHFDITLKADTLKNFVALLHYYNGEWRLVENAEVTNNGEHLEFDEDEFSPFAIVVSTADIVVPPEPANNCLWIILLILLLVIILVALAIWYFYRRSKKAAEEEN
jgi:flagellar basal body-associated protein FliL